MFEYSKLHGRIIEKFGTLRKFELAMGLSNGSVSHCLKRGSKWTNSNMAKACTLLDIAAEEIPFYFFSIKN